MIRREPVRRIADHRGALTKAWPGPVSGEVYAVELLPGHPRGHHVHRAGGEWFVALTGAAWLVVEHPDTDAREVHRLSADRLYVPAGIAHALFCDTPALVLAIAEVHFDHEHTVPHRVSPPTLAEREAAQ
jgi:oxalate decarboxylase/phosphoglucose isomerase-like protein (cupin superfamily)